MKRFVVLVLAAALMLGAQPALAAEIKVSGWSAFAFEWGDASFSKSAHSNGNVVNDGGTASQFHQRFYAQVDIIASEALSGVVAFEIGETTWGKSYENNTGQGSGGAFGTDGVSVEVKHMFVDWLVPNTDAQMRMGLQPGATPSLTGLGPMVMDDDVAGITLSNQFNSMVTATAWWFRPYFDNADDGQRNTNNKLHSTMDMFGLALPLSFDTVKLTPWGMWATVGRDSLGDANDDHTIASIGMLPAWMDVADARSSRDSRGDVLWIGLSGELVNLDPFRLAFDANYGAYDGNRAASGDNIRSRGWVMNLLAEYKLDSMTPGLVFWYGAGDDKSRANGSEMMPVIDPGFIPTSFGFGDQPHNSGFNNAVSDSAGGTWGLMLRLADISFIDDLSHTARLAYYRGTNSKNMIQHLGSPRVERANMMYMTEKDDAWEVNLDSFYDIYKNLQLGVELDYIRYNLDGAWGAAKDDFEKDAYKVSIGMKYSF